MSSEQPEPDPTPQSHEEPTSDPRTDSLANTASPDSASRHVGALNKRTESRPPAADGSLACQGTLHPSSLVFEALSQIRQYIVPLLFGFAGIASGSLIALWIAGSVFSITFVVTLVRFWTLRYRIDGDDFVVTEGLLFRRERSVPIRRIQNVDLVQNVLHRLFSVAVVNIETASGSEPEATLRVLTHQQIDQLRSAIFRSAPVTEPAELSASPTACTINMETIAQSDEPAASPDQSHKTARPVGEVARKVIQGLNPELPAEHRVVLRAPVKLLCLAGLGSNRGLVLVGIVVGIIFQNDAFLGNQAWFKQVVPDNVGRDWFRQKLRDNVRSDRFEMIDITGGLYAALLALAGVLLLLLLLRCVSIVWYILRFYEYQLSRDGNDLRISCGLFTKVSATIPRERIQFVSVHRTFFMRMLGLAAIRIETAGGGGNQDENAATTVSRRWFVPVLSIEDVPRVLAELRPDFEYPRENIAWESLAPRAGARLVRFSLVISLVITLVGWLVIRPWGWLAGPAAAPLLLWVALKKARSRRYALLPSSVVYQSGLLTKKQSFCFFDRIQALSLHQSPFDRRWRMASLRVDTAAAGPADHLVDVQYLDHAVARDRYLQLSKMAAAHRPKW